MFCIFCKRDSSASKSIEHIVPESLGSKKRVLAPGIVCDQCNNYFARKVEEPVLNHPSMRNFRAWYQVPNKRGRFPSLHGHIAGTNIAVSLRLNSDGSLLVEPERERDSKYIQTEIDRGALSPLLFKIEMDPPKREMSRFLCKMALETVAETLSAQARSTEIIVDSDFFNPIRDYARFGMNYAAWPYSQRRIFPVETLMCHPNTDD